MLRVSRVEEWLTRPRVGEHDCVIIRAARDGSGIRAHPDISPHLVMLPPGTRGLPHHHRDHETAIYIVSGEAEVWHGQGLGQRSTVRSGDFLYIPPRTEHFAANHGEVTTIAVVARTDPAADASTVVIELPRHLADLVTLPVALQE